MDQIYKPEGWPTRGIRQLSNEAPQRGEGAHFWSPCDLYAKHTPSMQCVDPVCHPLL